MQKKTRKILLIAGLLFLVEALYLLGHRPVQAPTVPTVPQDKKPVKIDVPSSEEEKMTVETSKGTVTMNNLYKDPISHLSDNGVEFKENSYYYMAYYPQGNAFIIAMMNADIETARQMAEKDFLEILGISKDDACKLNVSLTVPMSVNAEAAGGDYHLSFCPNGEAFPGK